VSRGAPGGVDESERSGAHLGLVNDAPTLSETPPAGSSPGSWKSRIEMLVKLAMPGSVRSFVNSSLLAAMKARAFAWTDSDRRRHVNWSCVMRYCANSANPSWSSM